MSEFHQNRSQQGYRIGCKQHEQWTGRGVCDTTGSAAWNRVGFEIERGGIQKEEKEKEEDVKETEA